MSLKPAMFFASPFILAGLIVGAVAVGATALNGNLTTLFANLNKSVAAAAKTAG